MVAHGVTPGTSILPHLGHLKTCSVLPMCPQFEHLVMPPLMLSCTSPSIAYRRTGNGPSGRSHRHRSGRRTGPGAEVASCCFHLPRLVVKTQRITPLGFVVTTISPTPSSLKVLEVLLEGDCSASFLHVPIQLPSPGA